MEVPSLSEFSGLVKEITVNVGVRNQQSSTQSLKDLNGGNFITFWFWYRQFHYLSFASLLSYQLCQYTKVGYERRIRQQIS